MQQTPFWLQVRDAARQIQDLITDRCCGSAHVVIPHAEGYLLHAQVTLALITGVESRRGGGSEVIHYVAVQRSLRWDHIQTTAKLRRLPEQARADPQRARSGPSAQRIRPTPVELSVQRS